MSTTDPSEARRKQLSDLYAEIGAALEQSMLEGKSRKRKLGEEEEEEARGAILSDPDPLTGAFQKVAEIETDQEKVLATDPIVGQSRYKKGRGSGATWKRRIYEAARAAKPGPFAATGNDVGEVSAALWQSAKGNAGLK